jgi:hypothetical protein
MLCYTSRVNDTVSSGVTVDQKAVQTDNGSLGQYCIATYATLSPHLNHFVHTVALFLGMDETLPGVILAIPRYSKLSVVLVLVVAIIDIYYILFCLSQTRPS